MIVLQLCKVLEYLHTLNPPVIFRDLKPGNVMLTGKNEVKLIDFGIARFFKPGQTRDTVNLGTPGYAAPELYGGAGQSDPRTDVYSLGVLLYQMLTGYDPTAAVTPFPLPDLRSVTQELPSNVIEVISRAIQLRPDWR
jgi:serine/threonine-protein kinase